MQVAKPKKGYKLVKTSFGKYEEIPEEWEYPKFNEVVKTNPSTKIEDKTVPYIPMDSVDTKKPSFNYTEERLLSENNSLNKFQDNDVLFARITPSTENGKTSFVENFRKKGIVSSELTVLRPSEKVFPKYLYYYIKSDMIRQFAISQMTGTTGRQRVPDSVFKEVLHFALPPLPEQKQITSILSNVDDTLQKTNQIIEQTQRLKKGLMQKLLARREGHTITKLKNLCVFSSGEFLPTAKQKNGDIPVFGGNGITGRHNISLIKTPTIIIGRVGVYCGSVYLFKKECWITDNAIFIKKLNEEIHIDYLFRLLSNFNINFLADASAQPKITQSTLGKLEINYPDQKEQQKIVSILSNVDTQIQKEKLHKSNLERLKKGLMQKLLTGQIRVKVR